MPRPYESTRVADANRFEDEPEPSEDDQIKSHYLKHHPFYEFKNFDDLQVDGYKHWLHGRADYYQTETYPGEQSAWEQGSKIWHSLFMAMPIISMWIFGSAYRAHCKNKNIKKPIVGVFSQHSA